MSELVALDWDHLDLDADPAEVYLPGGIQKGTKRDAYLDLDELEALGIDHGRDRDDSANTLPTRVEAGLEKEPESKEEQIVQIFKEIGRHHRQSDQ